MPHLDFQLAGKSLFVHPLRSTRLVVGRSDSCDIALPGDDVSRVHVVLEARDGAWWMTDRSRHGTRVNGTSVVRQQLANGDVIGIGEYAAHFWTEAHDTMLRATSTAPLWQGQPEELIEVGEGEVTAGLARLHFTRGTRKGEQITLSRPRTRLGGPGADVALTGLEDQDPLVVRVVRSRVMLEPGDAPVRLAGQRLRELTPALSGEEVSIGEHTFLIDVTTVQQRQQIDSFGELVGQSVIMRELFAVMQRMARHDHPVLLTGESGTGKELAARALHSQSPRADRTFVAVNCASISDTLFESELFGYEKGAFTGADEARDGAFQTADGGVLFLDEVGELKLEAQAKLLRALESREVRRVGGTRSSWPDVRVITATNRDIRSMIAAGKFREDLYFRLAVLTLTLPALRDRGHDVVELARTLLARHHAGATLAEDAEEALLAYKWPGNVRELKNVLTRAVVLGGTEVRASDLHFQPSMLVDSAKKTVVSQVDERERELLLAALERNKGNRAATARELGMARSSLLYKLLRLGIQ